MATYKVIQDIEAEDKLVGPLSLRQFLYAIVVAVIGFIAYQLALIQILLAIPLLPVILLFGFLAAPLAKDQPSEIWLYSRIRFFLKPRKRVWDQAGLNELVTITAPKRDEVQYTDNLSQVEVKSRLKALADTIDSRGWAVKSAGVGLAGQPYTNGDDSDRLLQPASYTDPALADVHITDDMLDEQNNPIARQFDQMIHAATESHREALIQHMREVSAQPVGRPGPPKADYWFLDNPAQPQYLPPGQAAFAGNTVVAPAAATSVQKAPLTVDEKALLDKVHRQEERMDIALGRVQKQPQAAKKPVKTTSQKTSPTPDSPAILELASNDDLNVETIARQAKKSQGKGDDGEVVISLH